MALSKARDQLQNSITLRLRPIQELKPAKPRSAVSDAHAEIEEQVFVFEGDLAAYIGPEKAADLKADAIKAYIGTLSYLYRVSKGQPDGEVDRVPRIPISKSLHDLPLVRELLFVDYIGFQPKQLELHRKETTQGFKLQLLWSLLKLVTHPSPRTGSIKQSNPIA